MFFRGAVKRKLIPSNPFQDVSAKAGSPKEWRFVTRAEIDKVLVVCPDVNWQCIVVLARYEGLRCPSEV
jgi:hypothetical protein